MGVMWRYLSRLAVVSIAMFCVVMQAGLLRAATPPPLSTYGKLPGIERVAISPSGDRVAMIGVVEDTRSLLVLNMDKGAPISYPMGDTKVRGLFWAGEDRVLLYKSDTQGIGPGFTTDKAELYSMIVIPLNGEESWSVFGNDDRIGGGVRQVYGIQRRDGRYYGYFGGMTYDGDFRSPDRYLANTDPVLYEVDLQSKQTRAIAPRFSGDGWREWIMQSGGKVGATLDYTSKSGRWVIRNIDGNRIAEGVNPLGRIDLVGLGTTPDTFIYSETLEGDDTRWFELPLAGGTPKEILADTALDHAYFDDNNRQLVGYRVDGDVPAYHFSDSYRQKVINATLKAFPGLLVHLKDWNETFDRLIVMTEGVGDPQTWWMIDIKTGKARDLGVSYILPPDQVAPMRMVTYKAGDGLDIAAVLTLPPGRPEKNLPVVILPHGGPAARDYPGFDWWPQALASRGYAVLQPNFRGSTGYGINFQRAGNGQWGRLMQSDISDGLAYLAAQGTVDPKRACIMGASYGGYAALAGVTLQQGLYRCAVSFAGVSDVARMAATDMRESNYDRTMKRAIEQEIGTRQDLRAISPVNFAAKADAPVLLIHGKDDLVVPFDQSRIMESALRSAGKPVEMVTLRGEDHWLSRGDTRLSMLEAAVRFLEKHNPPDSIN